MFSKWKPKDTRRVYDMSECDYLKRRIFYSGANLKLDFCTTSFQLREQHFMSRERFTMLQSQKTKYLFFIVQAPLKI